MSTWPIRVTVNDAALPIAHLTLAFASCPVFDPPGKEGLACLTNRLMCRGTQTLNYSELSEAVEALGTELLTSTQRNTVTVGGTILTRHIERYLGLLADIVCKPRFDADDLEKVRRELLAEHGLLLDDDNQLARHWLRSHLFPDSPVGNAAIGQYGAVELLTLQEVQHWHEQNYVQERLVVGASGHIETNEFRDALNHFVHRIPQGSPRTWLNAQPPQSSGRRVLLIDKPERAQSQILIGQSLGGFSEPEYFALKRATSSFGGTFTSRLMQEIRVKRGLSYGAYAWISQERNSNVYLLGASTDANRTVETLKVLLHEFDHFADKGLSDEEIEFTRLHLLNGYPFTIETAAQEASNRLRAQLSGWQGGHLERWRTFLQSPHVSETNTAIRKLIAPSDCTIAIVCTVTANLAEEIAKLEGVIDVQTISYRDHLDR